MSIFGADLPPNPPTWQSETTNDYPIKTCEYCKKEGKAYTFMTGETICNKCLMSMPTTTYELRKELYHSRTRVTELVRKLEKLQFSALVLAEKEAEVAKLKAENEEMRGRLLAYKKDFKTLVAFRLIAKKKRPPRLPESGPC